MADLEHEKTTEASLFLNMPRLALLIDDSILLVNTSDTGETFTIMPCGNDKEDRKSLFMVVGSSRQPFVFE